MNVLSSLDTRGDVDAAAKPLQYFQLFLYGTKILFVSFLLAEINREYRCKMGTVISPKCSSWKNSNKQWNVLSQGILFKSLLVLLTRYATGRR